MSQRTPAAEDLRLMTGAWWIVGIIGVLSVIAGIIVIAKPSNSLDTLAVVTGIFVLVDGIFAIVQALGPETQSRGLVATMGIVGVIVGILLIRHPGVGVRAVALLLGLWLIAAGAVRAVVAFEFHEHRWRRLLVAAVLVIAGIVIAASPHIGYATLAVIAGIGFIAYGVTMIMLGVAIRTVGHDVQASSAPGGAVPT